jgi:hypothetical protein
MGQYRIEITAVGVHGCMREVPSGGTVLGCRQMDCPDCQAREFVRQLQRTGSSIESATLTHWPGQEAEVRDDLRTGTRTGSF